MADAKAPAGVVVFLTGIVATGLVITAVAVTFRLNMGDFESGWAVTLWRVTMFGSFLALGLTLLVPLLRRPWLGKVVTSLICGMALLTLCLAFATASASVAGLVLTLPIVILLLGLALVLVTIFHAQICRYPRAVATRASMSRPHDRIPPGR